MARLTIIYSCDIKQSYKSDHSCIKLIINPSNFSYWKGLWMFNNSLLKQENYLDANTCNVIQVEKFKYALLILQF